MINELQNYLKRNLYLRKYLPLDYYHIILKANNKLTIEAEGDKSILVFLLFGDAKVADDIDILYP